jgi:hypothetical protein
MGNVPEAALQGGKRLWRWKDVERHLAAEADDAPTAPSEHAQRITNATRKALQGA